VVLWAIKAVHSVVFLMMLSAIGWLVATGFLGRRDRTVAVAGALVTAETVVFVTNGGTCPLTPLARRFGAERGGVSDIFLPDAIARTIPIWSGSLLVLAAVLHLRGLRGSARSQSSENTPGPRCVFPASNMPRSCIPRRSEVSGPAGHTKTPPALLPRASGRD
jgi:hypothetical protein